MRAVRFPTRPDRLVPPTPAFSSARFLRVFQSNPDRSGRLGKEHPLRTRHPADQRECYDLQLPAKGHPLRARRVLLCRQGRDPHPAAPHPCEALGGLCEASLPSPRDIGANAPDFPLACASGRDPSQGLRGGVDPSRSRPVSRQPAERRCANPAPSRLPAVCQTSPDGPIPLCLPMACRIPPIPPGSSSPGSPLEVPGRTRSRFAGISSTRRLRPDAPDREGLAAWRADPCVKGANECFT